MKRITILILFLFSINYLFAQEQTYRGVIQVTSQELCESNDSLLYDFKLMFTITA